MSNTAEQSSFTLKAVPFYPDAIPIVFASDNNYVPYMSATIQSIIENSNQSRKYIFFILHRTISNESASLLNKQVSPHQQFSIEFIDVTEYVSKYDLFVSRHITVEAYYRFLIPEIFYKYEKAIYLDCDMIVLADISELFDIDLGNHILASTRDITVLNWHYASKVSKKVAGTRNSLPIMKDTSNYFCDGLCFFNIPLFRNTVSQTELFDLAMANEWDSHDQDVLNILCEGKVLFLPFHWGFYKSNDFEYFPENYKNEYIDAMKHPKIIHFTSKPWKSYYGYRFESFWKYATRSPFINNIINNMRSNNMLEQPIKKMVLGFIKKRRFGLKFILFDCVRAWIFRGKIKKK